MMVIFIKPQKKQGMIRTSIFVRIICSGVAVYGDLPNTKRCYAAALTNTAAQKAALPLPGRFPTRHSQSRRNLLVAAVRGKRFIATGAVNAGMAVFAGRLPSRGRGGAKSPLEAAWAGDDARCLLRWPFSKALRQHASWRLREGFASLSGSHARDVVGTATNRFPQSHSRGIATRREISAPLTTENATEADFRRDRPMTGTHFRIEAPPYHRGTAGTAPKDSRAYGCRGSFHLIATCDSTAPIFPPRRSAIWPHS
jgi:hypothetical protein